MYILLLCPQTAPVCAWEGFVSRHRGREGGAPCDSKQGQRAHGLEVGLVNPWVALLSITCRLCPGTSPGSKQRFPRTNHHALCQPETSQQQQMQAFLLLLPTSPRTAGTPQSRADLLAQPPPGQEQQERSKGCPSHRQRNSQGIFIEREEPHHTPSLKRRCKQLSSLLKVLSIGSRDDKEKTKAKGKNI